MQHLQRLSGLDASFLYLETSTQPLCSALELDTSTIPGGYSFSRMRDELAVRIQAIPTFREKLANFLNLDHPVWGGGRGVRPRTSCAPDRATAPKADGWNWPRSAGHLAPLPLDRRPLWEMWAIEGLDGQDPRGGRSRC